MENSVLSRNQYGYCLIATRDLAEGMPVEKFTGEITSYGKVPEKEIRYVLLLAGDRWLIPDGNARYINHSCNPNCKIDRELNVVTKRNVKNGEELTISYNIITKAEYEASPEDFFWDERWSFRCMCQSGNCQRMVDRYILVDTIT